jgi:general secretion pathway protein I
MSAGHQGGFTLIEVLVALAILSLAVVASIQGFAQGLRLLRLAGDHQQAMLLADQKVREVVEPKEGSEQGTEGTLRWERTTRSLETPDLAPAGSAPRGRVYEIDVRVSWEAKRQVEIRTLRMVTPQTTEIITTTQGTPGGKGGAATPSKGGIFGPQTGTSPATSTPTSPFGTLGRGGLAR